MPKKGHKSITIKAEVYDRLSQYGGPSNIANSVLYEKLKEREKIILLMEKVTKTPNTVRTYT